MLKRKDSMLIHTKGNLLDLAEAGQFDVIVQGCNCFNTMGAGIAKEIRERYPQAYLADKETECGDYDKLGNYTLSRANVADFTIINAYTQYGLSSGHDVFDYNAFELILSKLLHRYKDKSFGFPYIGMGLAGGNKWAIIGMLERFADENAKAGGTTTLVEFAKV